MRSETTTVDVSGLAGKFERALHEAGFDFDRPSLAAALVGYEE